MPSTGSPVLRSSVINNDNTVTADGIWNRHDKGDPCHLHMDCDECYSSSKGCHWCGFDSQCHAKGSIHGCTMGASCPAEGDNGKNSSSNNDNNTCHSHKNCTDCYASSFGCHWCSFDSQCHAKGSIHGCTEGATCPSDNNTNSSSDDNDNSCHSHKNCTECSASSFGCHWCGFDNQCHAKASIYGCAMGVSCFSNDRCRRHAPERKHTPLSITPGVDVVILSVFLLSLCCCSFCFYSVKGLRLALSELSDVFKPPGGSGSIENSQMRTPLLSTKVNNSEQNQSNSDVIELSSLLDRNGKQSEEIVNQDIDEDGSTNEFEESHNSAAPPLEIVSSSSNEDVSINRSQPKRMKASLLYSTCKIFYIISTMIIVVSTVLIIIFFPRIPVINVCNDQLEWKSIIDGLTSMKLQASVQILISIYNANRIHLKISSLSGTFSHDGKYVGKFEIPRNTYLADQSINDILATVTVTPDKNQAIAIVSDYYKGTLTVSIDLTASVEIPIFEGYNYRYVQNGIIFHLSDMSLNSVIEDHPILYEDPHELCHCPG